jgi:hypothetical protein
MMLPQPQSRLARKQAVAKRNRPLTEVLHQEVLRCTSTMAINHDVHRAASVTREGPHRLHHKSRQATHAHSGNKGRKQEGTNMKAARGTGSKG